MKVDVYHNSSLTRDAREIERWNRLHPGQEPRQCHVRRLLPGGQPVVAATDYVCAVPQMIAPYINGGYTCLGTDGFGRSDTRSKLRGFSEVDRHHIALAALTALCLKGHAATPSSASA